MIDTVAGASDEDDQERKGGRYSSRVDTSTPMASERRGRRKQKESV